MYKESIVDFMPLMQKLFLAPDFRSYFDLLFNQTKSFENVFLQNVSLIFDKIKDGSFKKGNTLDLAEIMMNKFEIDLCSLDYRSKYT